MKPSSYRPDAIATGITLVLLFLCGTALAQTQPRQNPKLNQPANTTIQAPQFQAKEPDYQKLQQDLAALEKQEQQLLDQLKAFDQQQKNVLARVQQLEKYYDGNLPSGSEAQLLEATKEMQEMQMSFNLQYLQLQNQMQHENRSYTAISNIMKTKHDTVKNSISNIR